VTGTVGAVALVVVSIEIDRTPEEIWADLRDIASHVHWMADAAEIRFTSERREGVGTVFECDTRVGPLRTTDVMEITSWEPAQRMGVRHKGVVTGEGEFLITSIGERRSEFRWEEDLVLPWWLGGRIGETVGRPVLAAIWRRNLTRLRERLEAR